MKKYFPVLLMFGLVLMLCIAVLAQTGAPPEIFGVSSFMVTLALGFASSVLSSIFKRTHFADWIKYAIVYSVSFVFAVAAWLYAKQYVGDALTQNIGVTFLAIVGAAQTVFVILKSKVLKPIEVTINAGK